MGLTESLRFRRYAQASNTPPLIHYMPDRFWRKAVFHNGDYRPKADIEDTMFSQSVVLALPRYSQRFEYERECRRWLSTTWIVEVIAGKRLAPVLQHTNQPALLKVRGELVFG